MDLKRFLFSLSSTGDAIEDIMRHPRFEGAIESISWLTSLIDQYFVAIISAASMFIIGSALLKNVVAAAVVANPKFWGKVDQAKKSLEGNLQSKGGPGALAATLLGFLPNFLELSDVSDETVSPRHYFIKSIPQMFAIVMIGVFIYNGYYRDVAVKTSQFGSVMFQRFILTVEPVEIIDRLVANVYQPKVNSSYGSDDKSKAVAQIAKAAYASVISKYNDITENTTKDAIMNVIETKAWEMVNGSGVSYSSGLKGNVDLVNDSFDRTKYKVSIKVSMAITPPNIEQVTRTDNAQNFTLFRVIDVVPELGINSAKEKDVPWKLVVAARHEWIPDKGNTSLPVDSRLVISRVSKGSTLPIRKVITYKVTGIDNGIIAEFGTDGEGKIISFKAYSKNASADKDIEYESLPDGDYRFEEHKRLLLPQGVTDDPKSTILIVKSGERSRVELSIAGKNDWKAINSVEEFKAFTKKSRESSGNPSQNNNGGPIFPEKPKDK